LEEGIISVPESKITALKIQSTHAVVANQLRACQLASTIGKIIAMLLAVGPASRLMTRSMYALLSACKYWCQSLNLMSEAKQELHFWNDQISTLMATRFGTAHQQ